MARIASLLLVSCATGAFRRAGMAFGKEPVVVDLDELSDEQVEAIESEPKLTIETADEDALERIRSDAHGDNSGDEERQGLIDQLDQLEKDLEQAREASADQGKANAALSERVGELEAQLKTVTAERDLAEKDKAERGDRIDQLKAEVDALKAAAGEAKPAVKTKTKGSDAS